jgi:hypothetical protein
VDRIAFTTLLMGLVVGIQPVRVELAPDLKPAAIVYSLDGSAAGGATAAPWEARVDFGRTLRPHVLTAAALDAEGNRMAMVSRTVNLPAPPARVDILLDRNARGSPIGVHLVATSLRQEKPLQRSLTLDERPLDLDESGHAPLPALDLQQTHVLSAVAVFNEQTTARADLALGGERADESGSRLTAIAIRVPDAGSMPTPASLAGRLHHGTDPVRVLVVEKGPATILLVRSPSNENAFRALRLNPIGTGLKLEPDDRIGMVWPLPHEERIGDQTSRLMESTPFYSARDSSLLGVLTTVNRRNAPPPPYSYADAVAVAGLEAYHAGTRRAVVIASGYTGDTSQLTTSQVRGYLQNLGVPLHVWTFGSLESPWGKPAVLSSIPDYGRATNALKLDLESQRIVWAAGEWMPGQLELAPGEDGISLLR